MLLNLLVVLLILALVFGLVLWCISMLPLPAPFGRIAQVVVVLILIVVLLGVVFGGVSLPALVR